jgi:ATPase family protein associated with various cellular activities (AAA)
MDKKHSSEDREDSKVELNRLRVLRSQANDLLSHIVDDLKPFLNEGGKTFRRKPDSRSDERDVNVTTTCSCLMALAFTDQFGIFYDVDDSGAHDKARDILNILMDAPWMSSGLMPDNAFTTGLVLRMYGFLVHHDVLKPSDDFKKAWSVALPISDSVELTRRLRERADEASWFLYRSFSDNTRDLLDSGKSNDDKELAAAIKVDLRRVVHGGSIYESSRFPHASENTKRRLAEKLTSYQLAQVNYSLLIDEFPGCFEEPSRSTLGEIAKALATNINHFKVNDYPASPAIVYWFLDGITHAKIPPSKDHWKDLCDWAGREFNRQRSRVVANHDAVMDPVAMAMAACLCARLRTIKDIANEDRAILPSVVELEHSVAELFQRQRDSGIWPKYFPMFHYRDQEAGSNFCFTFELLEAVLNEFGASENHLLDDAKFIRGLERAVDWCKKNRLRFPHDGVDYTGWNSGGYLQTLQKDQPESWATAVVHMFLTELSNVLSERIQQRILEKYGAYPAPGSPDTREFDRVLDIELLIKGQSTSLKELLCHRIIIPNADRTEKAVRHEKISAPKSALLFGPPGTSKTRLTKAIAEALNWPCIVIDPSEFVKGTLANVYLQADVIFDDLMDLSGVVVFFDEVDALTQSRAGERLDIERQFLTTTMLPKLARLYDKGQVIFLMATNFFDDLDPAIKRAGRFDLLLCMGPPTFEEKLKNLPAFVDGLSKDQGKVLGDLIESYVKDSWYEDQLGLYTFGEFESFLNGLGSPSDIYAKLKEVGAQGFKKIIDDDCKYVAMNLSEIIPDRKTRLSDRKEDLAPKSPAQPREIERYLLERSQSKEQW